WKLPRVCLVRPVFEGQLMSGGCYNLHAEFRGFPLQCEQLAFGALVLKMGSATVYIGLAFRQQAMHQACQVTSHRLDGFLASESRFQVAIPGSQIAVTPR